MNDKETILIVDDGEENRNFVIDILEPAGYNCIIAKDGQEGLESATKNRPDLILLDFQMPRMNGEQVLQALRKYNLDIPVILMTFHGTEEIAITVYRLGVKDYLKKPFEYKELLEAVDRALTEYRLRRERDALTDRVIKANKELQQRLQELNVLYNVGKHVTSIADIAELLPRIVDACIDITKAEEGMIYILEDDQLVCRAWLDQKLAHAKSGNEIVEDPIARHVINSRQPIVLTPEQMAKNPIKNHPNSIAYAPLINQDSIIGVIGVANFTPNARVFNENDMHLLSALSDYAAIGIVNSRQYTALEVSKDQVRDTFQRFVPEAVVEKALGTPGNVQLGGQRQEVSVLFADIRGYTSWSENAPPEQVIETLNNYLSIAADLILGWQGTLDKFLGDGLMAIFNAPNPQENHVHLAADASLALIKAVNEVNERYGHKLTYSIGVHVGEAVVGYIGSDRALNYTAIGDTVNLAKRLQESAAPGQILVEEVLVNRLKGDIEAKFLGELKVKGRKNPARVYELIDLYS